MASKTDKDKQLDELFNTFIDASHILHYNGVVDAYGHLSFRNPFDPSTFFMSRNLAPALVSSREDIVEYRVEDASPVNSDAPSGFSERCIHSEMLKKYPGLNSVVHSHCAEVLPYCISRVPLAPTIHMSGFLSSPVPLWDIAQHYQSSDRKDLLVRNTRLGAALADAFVDSGSTAAEQQPVHTVVLMRGHGFTTAGPSIEHAVYQAVYTRAAAMAQSAAVALQSGWNGLQHDMGIEAERDDAGYGDLLCLSRDEAADAWAMNRETVGRPWGLWLREVRACPVYRNEEGERSGVGGEEWKLV